jgi:CelD/BcsL family acetyltransferase involved in cellulose biosynthesis
VREADDFQSLKENWNCLLKRNLLGNNVFLTWEWLSTWWKHFGEGRKPLILLVEDGDEPLAAAPLMLSRYKLPGFGAIKTVEFLGARHSDYNNFIILKRETECLKLITDYLVDNVADWDWIELKDIPENENGSNHFFSDIPLDLDMKERVCNVCPFIALPESFEGLMKGLSSNMRQDLRKKLRRIQKDYRVDLKKFDEAGLSVNEAMKTFIELHQTKWTSEGFPGAFNEQVFRDFHMEVAERFADKGWLGLYFLMANDEPISGHYSFEYEQKSYYYLSAFLPQYSVHSPGSIMIMLVLKRCIENGITEYDLMRGADAYKKRWTHSYRKNSEIRLVRKNIHSKFYNWITWSSTLDSLARKFNFSLKKS